MCNRLSGPICPVELVERVQLYRTAKDLTVISQGLTSGTGEVHVRRRIRHASDTNRDPMLGSCCHFDNTEWRYQGLCSNPSPPALVLVKAHVGNQLGRAAGSCRPHAAGSSA